MRGDEALARTHFYGRFMLLRKRWIFLETVDLVVDLVVGVAWFSIFTTLVATGASLLFTLVGLPILTMTFYLARAAAALERRRARVFLATEIATPMRAQAKGDGALQRLVTPLRDRATWKELLYVWLVQPVQSVVNFTIAVTAWAVPLWALTLPIYGDYSPIALAAVAVGGLLLLPLAPWVLRRVAAADRATARWGLEAPTEVGAANRRPVPARIRPGADDLRTTRS